MTPAQLKLYDTLMDNAPPWVAYKIKQNLPPSKAEAAQLNAFLMGARQVSNTTAPFQATGAADEPKLDTAYAHLRAVLDAHPRAKAVVYSNFLGAGLDPYKRRLEAANIPYGAFTGEMSKARRDDLVRQYNDNKLRALLISSAGGEGLDLKGTRLIQVLDPHWNEEKLKQVEGRGIRYRSHADLPEAERDVLVQRYLTARPRQGWLQALKLQAPEGSVDQYIAQRAAEKEQLIDQFRQLLRQNNAA
jgi:SNF2 family DNA or RNA helicase